MGLAIGEILPLAVGVALSPVQIVAAIMILFTPRARTNGPAFAMGWLFGLFVSGSVVIALADAGDVDTDSGAADLAYVLRLALGVILLAAAARQWQRRPAEGETGETPAWMTALDTFTAPKAFGLGVLSATVNPKVFALTVAAGLSIGRAGLDTAEALVSLGAFVVISSVTVAGPVLYYLLAGQTAEKTLEVAKEWLIANKAAVVAVVFLAFGAVLVGQGIAGLTV